MDTRFKYSIIDAGGRAKPTVFGGRITREQITAATFMVSQWSVEFPVITAVVADK